MRHYWIKIIGGAFGIFVVGMLVISGIKSVKVKVNSTINSSDPIRIPLIGLIPFRVDSDKLGSLRRFELLRQSPESFSGVRVLVKLADSVSPDRLRSCVRVVDDVQHLNERSTFRCQAPGTALAGVEQFGTVVLQGGDPLGSRRAIGDRRSVRVRGGPVSDAGAAARPRRDDALRGVRAVRCAARRDREAVRGRSHRCDARDRQVRRPDRDDLLRRRAARARRGRRR